MAPVTPHPAGRSGAGAVHLDAGLPAAVPARTLGIGIRIGITATVVRRRAATGGRAAHAADVSRHDAPRRPIHEPGATP
ncbi:hypothetical protein [Streptomyces atrovirens]|uniref:Uncharacterized protein n=1 Tax=Streptomyces atrovirens TaxID=285556 RepID=A0ABW0DJH0_9ACTN